ncbi:MAG TPA: patatin-like phospholipase family protein [Bacteroidia bacterium]|nr:patatin-like phospholipase family protein [Bacteroidia bacterium]
MKQFSLVYLFVFCIAFQAYSQKVGLVLSGGGASGIAHIGVIKALEENNIPIDYITGTSMGAFIGALYAAGYTPQQMEQLALSREFNEIAKGTINGKYIYYFKQKPEEASWISFRFSLDTSIITSIPTHLVSPLPIDYSIMKYFSGASSAARDEFDSLMIPFRCVAADIVDKRPYIFKSGNLGEAIRASISYPFYLKPLVIDGKMLFDGGLYNNFPTDIMEKDFQPDVILGSNVSSNVEPPSEDNIISEIKNMLITRTVYKLKTKGLIVIPNVEAGILTADNPKALIDSGYNATIRQIPAIKALIARRMDSAQRARIRSNFEKRQHPLVFSKVNIHGVNPAQEHYIKKILMDGDSLLSINKMESRYYRVATDENMHSIYPMARYNDTTGFYNLDLSVKREKHFSGDIGGVISNRPISEGYVGLQYSSLANQEILLNGNFYFGKLYTSGMGSAKIYFPWSIPVYIKPEFVYNSWNYFTSSTDFYNDIRPPYLIQQDEFGKLDIGFPIGNKAKLEVGGSIADITSTYYQTLNFAPTDTADQTEFDAMTAHLRYDMNSLNRKMYASSGTRLLFQAQWIAGTEIYRPGSLNTNRTIDSAAHNWLQLKLSFDKYFIGRGLVRLGTYLEAVYSNSFINGKALQTYFTDYYATALMAPAFQPTPEMQTQFLPFYRAYNYVAGGPKFLISFKPNIDLRLEGYIFIPYQSIQNVNNKAVYSADILSTREYIATAAIVFHSPIGPMALSANYFDSDLTNPTKYSFSILFHVGFIIFNEKSIN